MNNGYGTGGSLPVSGQPLLSHFLTPDETNIAQTGLAAWRRRLILTGNKEVLREKPVIVSIYPPQIP
jgi:hypothetical protein